MPCLPLFRIRQDGKGGQGPVGVIHDLLQEDGQVVHHAGDGCRCKQVGVVFENEFEIRRGFRGEEEQIGCQIDVVIEALLKIERFGDVGIVGHPDRVVAMGAQRLRYRLHRVTQDIALVHRPVRRRVE